MTYCPSCGFNLSKDEPIERDGFLLDPRGTVSFCGRRLSFTKAEAAVLHSIGAAGSRTVEAATLACRFGDHDDPANVARVLVSRIRHRLAAYDVPCPVRTDHGRGYRWEVPA